MKINHFVTCSMKINHFATCSTNENTVCLEQGTSKPGTTWNNLRFHFSGRVSTAYGIYLRDFFLMVITFGIYYSWHEIRVRKYRMSHTCLGDSNFSFHGSGGELFGINILGYFLSYVTLGVYAPWYIANRLRFFLSFLFPT